MAAGCKMPAIYYYFKNKEDLVDQIVRVQYEELVDRLRDEIPNGLSLRESCVYRVKRKKTLMRKVIASIKIRLCDERGEDHK